jgi:hypothetical protein
VDIRIIEVANEGETVVTFTCDGGDGLAVWKGNDAVSSGESHDVELECEAPLHHSNGALTSAAGGRCQLSAHVEDIGPEGDVVLRIGTGLVRAKVDDGLSTLVAGAAVAVRDVSLTAWPTGT